ncbi:hypothetical protein KDM87_14970 [Undibacterium sp. FT147W]|uniref:DUF3072 domain-containing protein n=1 Tax=Undibacterium rivi TaxID=2828729 RepID=A0ABS5H728_9BURK|nr:hypothetical protein [Undibacterium rivi]MBR7793894.1 hypothetical protein [Undibacterium rivi]
MATTEQKADGKTGPDHIVKNGFDLDNAPRKKKMTPAEMEARIRAGQVDETLAYEDDDDTAKS